MDPTTEEEIRPPEVDETDQKIEVATVKVTPGYIWHVDAIWF